MVGDPIVFTDGHRVKHAALVTYEHNGGNSEEYPLGKVTVNLVYVSSDEKANDQYGRQTIHASSVSAALGAVKLAGGYYYELPEVSVQQAVDALAETI